MSYYNMDHAGWLESNIAAGKRMATKAEQRTAQSKQIGWCAAPDTLNDFHRRAADLIGIVGNGIYNAPVAWKSVWWHPNMMMVPWYHEVATYDFCALTRLVFLAHEARIRVGISAHGPKHLGLHLSGRGHEGGISRAHPSLDEAIADFRSELRPDHPIHYRIPTIMEAE